MCGRYSLTIPTLDLMRELGLIGAPDELTPRYNVAPSQRVAAVLGDAPGRIDLLRWGLIPSWAKDPSIGHRMINARAETAHEKPAFRAAFARRRCLVLADGFYEWKRIGPGTKKQPYYFQRAGHRPFAFAGLWERWKEPSGELLRTCTILTTVPTPLVAQVHDRMPVMLPQSDWPRWLDPTVTDAPSLAPLLRPYPSGDLECFPVSTIVNSPAHDVPECIVREGVAAR